MFSVDRALVCFSDRKVANQAEKKIIIFKILPFTFSALTKNSLVIPARQRAGELGKHATCLTVVFNTV